MTSCYLDTSFVVKLYVLEKHTPDATRQLRLMNFRPSTNWLTGLELQSALGRKVQDGALSSADAIRALSDFDMDEAGGVYDVHPVSRAIFELGKSLLSQHAGAIRMRSLDVLHVATALHYGLDGFATFDKELEVLARRVGLQLL